MSAAAPLGGRYALEEELGRGGMALVYRAHDLTNNKIVAVKILSPQHTPEDLTRFRREGEALAALAHPNLISVLDVGRDGNTDYIVMEYVAGGNLRDLIEREGPLSIGRTIDIARQICAGVAVAHRAGVVHRDLKPENVLMTTRGQVKVGDFGIARGASMPRVTETAVVMGTAQYISPEQAHGEEATPSSDVYSIGIILYEMLTGQAPFDGDTSVAIALKHLYEEPAPLMALNPAVPTALAEIVRSALAKQPAYRFHSAEALGRALAECERSLDARTAAMPAVEPRRPTARPTVPPPLYAPPPPLPTVAPPQPTVTLGVLDEDNGRSRRAQGLFFLLFGSAMLVVFVLAYLGVRAARSLELIPPANTPVVEVSGPAPTATSEPRPAPDLTGLPLDTARLMVEREGATLEVAEQRVSSSSVMEGSVVSQDPPARTPLGPGRIVRVVISSGPERITPSLVGLSLESAQQQLAGLGISPRVEEIWWPDAPAGQVTKQQPPARQALQPGQTVQLEVSTGSTIRLNARFGEDIVLERADLKRRSFRPNDPIDLVLYWRAGRKPNKNYTVFVHLVNPSGYTVAQADNEPARGGRPMSTWEVGDVIEDPYLIRVPQGGDLGQYRLEVGLYLPGEGMRRLTVLDASGRQIADHVTLPSIDVVRQ